MCGGVYILLLEDYECVTQHLFTEPTLFAQQRTDMAVGMPCDLWTSLDGTAHPCPLRLCSHMGQEALPQKGHCP